MIPIQRTAPGSAAATIGVFDSGLGGLSVLRALHRALPSVPITYIADSAWAPYGERSADEVCDRSARLAQSLIDDGARMLVVACNTATALAIPMLRDRWPQLPIIGVEPGVKPALAASDNGRIGVMATEGTLRSERFLRLLQREVAQAELARGRTFELHLQPCPGLAAAIETADLHSKRLRELVQRWCEPLRSADVDTVVLGCTHYPFVAPSIVQALGPAVRLIDTAEAVARQAARRWFEVQPSASLAAAATGPIAPTRYLGSGDLTGLRHAVADWLGDAAAPVTAFAR